MRESAGGPRFFDGKLERMERKDKMSKINRNFMIAATVLAGIYVTMSVVAKRSSEAEDIGRDDRTSVGAYVGFFKPMVDKVMSFAGLVLLAPFFVCISIVIWLDDPGPVLFSQKRVGKDRNLFTLHKFRTMKISTPHDVPTHQLENPEQYITKVGAFLRKTSLDELPQIWDIFRGKMSIIGPRPALWNQDDLVAEREKYGANGILPGLTGWAQINGRDELEIPDKARLDGEYTEKVKQGGIKAFFFDVKCFCRTIFNTINHVGVVEGGTGSIN